MSLFDILDNNMSSQDLENTIPDARYVADALWLDKFDAKKIPESVREKLASKAHSPEAYGERMRTYMEWLKAHQQSHNPNYSPRYEALKEAIKDLSPHQAYVIVSKFLGSNSVQGFDPIPAKANLQFPRDHEPKFHSLVGWHFFVGSVWDESGQEYGVELMFFRVALLPPDLARKLGLTDIENQVVEIQLGISKAGEMHHQADPTVVAGTSGLIQFSDQPFDYQIGKNEIKSMGKDKLLPLQLRAHGVDRSEDEQFELGLDFELTGGKEYLLQGDNGCMPSVAGMGSLYYSIPDIQLKAGGTLQYGQQKIKLKKGLLWFDHQWGFLAGNPRSAVLRAANNISKPAPAGWDWYMAQFGGDRQITMFAAHSNKYRPFYFQTGPIPPRPMEVPVVGKYMDAKKDLHNTWGTLKIDKWIKAESSPNPKLYPVTHTWHPNEWQFDFDTTMPEDVRSFTMEQVVPKAQTNFFANGSQYNEGAVYLKDPDGQDIGRGFAEAVQYADTTDNMYRLAGFADRPELIKILEKQTASWPKRMGNMMYVATHQKALKRTLEAAAGLEFFGPKPKDPKPRH